MSYSVFLVKEAGRGAMPRDVAHESPRHSKRKAFLFFPRVSPLSERSFQIAAKDGLEMAAKQLQRCHGGDSLPSVYFRAVEAGDVRLCANRQDACPVKDLGKMQIGKMLQLDFPGALDRSSYVPESLFQAARHTKFNKMMTLLAVLLVTESNANLGRERNAASEISDIRELGCKIRVIVVTENQLVIDVAQQLERCGIDPSEAWIYASQKVNPNTVKLGFYSVCKAIRGLA